jgi:glycosyltransferase involved in cell wall biosynthesis
LKYCIKSINNTSKLDNEIIVHVNEDLKGETRDYLNKNHIKYTFSKNNIGLCSSINLAVKSSSNKYILYTHDDMYFCPGWEDTLVNEINKINHNLFYISGSMIEANSGHIPYDCGNSLENFDEEKLLNNYMNLNIDDHQGSHFSPHCVHIDIWNKVGGFSEEFNPGMGSDPDFNMKLWKIGVRIFKGLNSFKVYHFGSLTTRKNKNIIRNNGDITFLKKWGITTKFLKKHYLKSKTKYYGPLSNPNKNILYFIDLLKCKIKLFYVNLNL